MSDFVFYYTIDLRWWTSRFRFQIYKSREVSFSIIQIIILVCKSYFVGQKSCSLRQPTVPKLWRKSKKLKWCYCLNASLKIDWKAMKVTVFYMVEELHSMYQYTSRQVHHQRNEERGDKGLREYLKKWSPPI